MEIGEHWMFRDRPKALGDPVHRVEVVRLDGPRRQGDAHVRFLDGPEAGLQEWVTRGQLIAPWNDVDLFLQDESRRLAVIGESVDVRGTTEYEAARFVFELIRSKNVFRLLATKAEAGVLEIIDLTRFAASVGAEAGAFSEQPLCFTDRNGILICPWTVTRVLARQLADKRGEEVLDKVLDQERRLRQHYDSEPSWRRDDKDLRQFEQVAAVLREWCTGEAVERFDELRALRKEVARLGDLVQRAVTELRQRKAHAIAATIERDLGALDATAGSTARR